MAEKRAGIGVDASGGAVVDPTANVIALNEAGLKRQDDLRTAAERFMEAASAHLKEMAGLRAEYSKDIRELESRRLDAIRQVDVTAVKTEADRALAAIQTLAAQTATNAENLRNALTATAATIAKQTSDTVGQLIERIAALEKSSYEGAGKSGVVDPMQAQLLDEVKRLREDRSATVGKADGINTSWLVVVAVISMLIAGGSVIYDLTKSPQIIYAQPAPKP